MFAFASQGEPSRGAPGTTSLVEVGADDTGLIALRDSSDPSSGSLSPRKPKTSLGGTGDSLPAAGRNCDDGVRIQTTSCGKEAGGMSPELGAVSASSNASPSPGNKGLPGHAAKTFPSSPSKAGGPSRAKMSLTGASKSPTSVQSLAMRLLSMPGSRLPGDATTPSTEALPPAPSPAPAQTPAPAAEEAKPKVHRARKTMSKPNTGQIPEKRVSEMLHFRVSDDLRSIEEPEEPAKRRKYDYMTDTIHKRMPLSLHRSSPRATTEITVTEEMTAPATASQEERTQEWETEVGDDFSLYYDSYSVDGHVDSDSK
ncbi:UNVERIFIED_CONTAM: hypothetical protein K2H54_060981, partial [Gekko kuhli]